MKSLNCGIEVHATICAILLHADGIELLAESEADLQKLLDTFYDWCKRWKMEVHCDKTKIMHFSPKAESRSSYVFKCGPRVLLYENSYKYLGIWLDEHLDYKKAVT